MLDYELRGATLIVRLTDELDHRAAADMRDELDALLGDNVVRKLVFDMKRLEFMDSSGIGFIIGRYKQLSQRGGRVAVKNANRQIERIFNMAGLYKLVEKLA